YAGENATDRRKVDYILEKMADVPEGMRQAAFRTVLAFVYSSEQHLFSEGKLEGELLTSFHEPLQQGLPYSCIFYVPAFKKTVSELKAGKIDYPSQRGQALLNLVNILKTFDF
ncbi:MAG: non-canonical purine NTP pyrophosphatase, partial [Bacteroidota bacterium]